MDRAKGQGVGSSHRVLGTPGPEDEVPEAAARWRQAARLHQDVRSRAGSRKSARVIPRASRLALHGPSGPSKPSPQASDGFGSRARVQPRSGWASVVPVGWRCSSAVTAWYGRGLVSRAQGRCLLPAARLGRWWQGGPQAVGSPRPNSV